jgi:hypothetical protein
MELDQLVKQLKEYVLNNYEAGGHWAYETFSKDDYVEYLQTTNSFDEAKAQLKEWCELMCERGRDCSWDGPPEGFTKPVWA